MSLQRAWPPPSLSLSLSLSFSHSSSPSAPTPPPPSLTHILSLSASGESQPGHGSPASPHSHWLWGRQHPQDNGRHRNHVRPATSLPLSRLLSLFVIPPPSLYMCLFPSLYLSLPSIQFPDPQSRYQSNQVIVTGAVDGVFRAREQLLVGVWSHDLHVKVM